MTPIQIVQALSDGEVIADESKEETVKKLINREGVERINYILSIKPLDRGV